MTVEEILKSIQDEKTRTQVAEALKNEWMPKSDFTKAQQAKAEELKVLQAEAEKFKAETDRFWQWYNTDYKNYVAQVKPIVEKHFSSNGQQQAATTVNPNGDPFADWDVMTPQQQAQRLWQLQQSQMKSWSENYAQSLQKVLADRESYYQNYLDIYIEANERKRQDPTLDIPAYMKRQLALKSGQASPEDAYKLETFEKEKEKWLEDGRKHGRQEAEQEFKAKKPAESVYKAPASEPFKPPAVSQTDRMAELRQKVAEKFPDQGL